MTLKEKYFKREGYTAFQLWMFAVTLDELSKTENELSKTENKSKAASLRERVIEFSESAWMSARGTTDEKKDLQQIIDEVTCMAID